MYLSMPSDRPERTCRADHVENEFTTPSVATSGNQSGYKGAMWLQGAVEVLGPSVVEVCSTSSL